MQMRTVLLRRCLAGLSSLAAFLAVTAPATAAPMPAAGGPGPAQAPGTAAWNIATPAVTRPMAIPDTCGRVRRRLARDAALGMRRVMCTQPARPLAASKLPALCHLNRQGFDRFADCIDTGWTVTIINVNTGEVVGSVTGSTVLSNSLAFNSRSWQEHIRVAIASVTDEGAASTFTAPIVCSPHSTGCKATGKGVWRGQHGFFAARAGAVHTGELGFESPSKATDHMAFQVDMVVDNPVANSAPLTIGPSEKIRCDSEAIFRPTKGGCVYQNATKVILLISGKDKTVKEAATFIKAAQNAIHTHPGVFGRGHALTRLTNRSMIRRNRRVACRGLMPDPGESCDEYPFASTHQGAGLVPHSDFRRKAVNGKQNSKVGTLLSIFLLHERIAGGDSYFVKIS
jgi:hypothetical protein